MVFCHPAGFSKKDSDNFMRIPNERCASEFVVGGLHLVCSDLRAHALWPGLALVLLNLKTFPKRGWFGGDEIWPMLGP